MSELFRYSLITFQNAKWFFHLENCSHLMFSGYWRFGKYVTEKEGRTFPVLMRCNKGPNHKALTLCVRLQEESNRSGICVCSAVQWLRVGPGGRRKEVTREHTVKGDSHFEINMYFKGVIGMFRNSLYKTISEINTLTNNPIYCDGYTLSLSSILLHTWSAFTLMSPVRKVINKIHFTNKSWRS